MRSIVSSQRSRAAHRLARLVILRLHLLRNRNACEAEGNGRHVNVLDQVVANGTCVDQASGRDAAVFAGGRLY
jgi:hypothetical protein